LAPWDIEAESGLFETIRSFRTATVSQIWSFDHVPPTPIGDFYERGLHVASVLLAAGYVEAVGYMEAVASWWKAVDRAAVHVVEDFYRVLWSDC
jgi:hypothetical protein